MRQIFDKINNKNLQTLFGLVITKGKGTLLPYPKRKDSLTQDWPEEQGTDIDLSNPTFEARTPTLTCALIGNDINDFLSKYNGLFTELSQPGTFDLYIDDHNRSYTLYFKEQQNYEFKTNGLKAGQVMVTFDLLLSETSPDVNMLPVYLVDDQDRFLTA